MFSLARRIFVGLLAGAAILLPVPRSEAFPPARAAGAMPHPMVNPAVQFTGAFGRFAGPQAGNGSSWGWNTSFSNPWTMSSSHTNGGQSPFLRNSANALARQAFIETGNHSFAASMMGHQTARNSAGFGANRGLGLSGSVGLRTAALLNQELMQNQPLRQSQAISPAVQALTGGLQDQSPLVRWRAINSLGNLGSQAQSAVPALANLLQDSDPSVRWAAARALSQIGPAAQQALPALKQALNDADAQVRQQVTTAVTQIGPDLQNTRQALTRLAKDGNPQATTAAEAALANLPQTATLRQQVSANAAAQLGLGTSLGQGTQAGSAIPTLLSSLSDSNPAVRNQATRALAALGSDALQPLLQGLGSSDSFTRLGAAQALGQMGSAARSALPMLQQLLNDSNPNVSLNAAMSMWQIGGQGSVNQIVPPLINALQSNNPSAQMTAAAALGVIGPKAQAAVPALTQASTDPNNVQLRLQSAMALWRINPTTSPLQTLQAGLTDAKPENRAEALALLGQLGPQGVSALPAVTLAAQDSNPVVRVQALSALSQFGQGAFPTLRTWLQSGNTTNLQNTLQVVAEMGWQAKPLLPDLLQQVQNPNPDLRAMTVTGLGQLANQLPGAVPGLVTGLQDALPNIRQLAVQGLGSLTSPSPDVQAALRSSMFLDANPGVRNLSWQMLQQMQPQAVFGQ